MACVCTKAVRGMSSCTKLMSTAHTEITVSASNVIRVDDTMPISATIGNTSKVNNVCCKKYVWLYFSIVPRPLLVLYFCVYNYITLKTGSSPETT